jgi:hypothetical protein
VPDLAVLVVSPVLGTVITLLLRHVLLCGPIWVFTQAESKDAA